MKKQAYRHGEIVLVKVEKLPNGLEVSKSKIMMTGSHGNNHSIDTGKLYFTEPIDGDFTFGYLVAKNTNLLHPEHKDKKTGKCKIQDGIYQLIKQNEYTPSGLIPIID